LIWVKEERNIRRRRKLKRKRRLVVADSSHTI